MSTAASSLGPRKAIVMVSRVIVYVVYVYLIVVEIILLLGFFLLLFGASPTASFTQWAYRNLDRVMEPFRGMFTPIVLGTTSGNSPSILDTSILFAMIIYGIVALLISSLVGWLSIRMRELEMKEAELERRREAELMAVPAPQPAVPTAPAAPSSVVVPAYDPRR